MCYRIFTLRIHYFQHIPFETLDSIADWAALKGHSITTTRFYHAKVLPALEELDWLIIMGGPMSTFETKKYDWLTAEKRFIEKAIRRNCTVLGICLGAQLIADVLGARVYPNAHKEIGWFPVTLTQAGRTAAVFQGFPAEFTACHWHGDTFDMPAGAQWLAQSAACKHQAFIYSERVIGLQFHLELSSTGLAQIIQNCSAELKQSPYIQTAEQLLSRSNDFEASRRLMFRFLDQI
jgi:GMP synthase-like glutamine amidotransferase